MIERGGLRVWRNRPYDCAPIERARRPLLSPRATARRARRAARGSEPPRGDQRHRADRSARIDRVRVPAATGLPVLGEAGRAGVRSWPASWRRRSAPDSQSSSSARRRCFGGRSMLTVRSTGRFPPRVRRRSSRVRSCGWAASAPREQRDRRRCGALDAERHTRRRSHVVGEGDRDRDELADQRSSRDAHQASRVSQLRRRVGDCRTSIAGAVLGYRRPISLRAAHIAWGRLDRRRRRSPRRSVGRVGRAVRSPREWARTRFPMANESCRAGRDRF